MKILYTAQAIESLNEALDFIAPKISRKKLSEIRCRILDKADTLVGQPFKGQIEPHLEHLNLDHRRIIEGNYKIIYRIEGSFIYVTDIFDSRQDPSNTKVNL
jgi:plasmid stabilization system protein ParE